MNIAEFAAGWIAGGTGVIIGHPLDLLKARVQTGSEYKNIAQAFRSIVKNESFLGLFKGMLAPCVSIGFINSILFAGYGATLRFLHPGELNIEKREDLPMTQIVFASTVGTMLQLIPAIPVELIKTRLQVQKEGAGHILHHSSASVSRSGKQLYGGPMDLVAQVVKKEGIKGLYKGGSVMAVRDMIGYLFYLPVYEGVKKILLKKNIGETTTQAIAGGTAGAMGWVSICPIEVVKNRVQVSPGLSPFDATRDVWTQHGIRGFLKGGLIMAIRGFPVNAAIFVVYENILKFINRNTQKNICVNIPDVSPPTDINIRISETEKCAPESENQIYFVGVESTDISAEKS